MFDVLLVEQHAEASVAEAGAVVGEDASAGEAEAGEVSPGHVEEAPGGGMLLAGQDGGEGEPAVVIDGDVQVLVACASGLASAIAVDAVAGLDDAGQAFDVEVDQIAGMRVLGAHHRRWRIERAQPVHAGATQDAADGSAAELEWVGDAPAIGTQPAKGKNLFDEKGGGLARAAARPGTAVAQGLGTALLEAPGPLCGGLCADSRL